MRDKIKYNFSPQELDVIIRSLNLLRNYLSAQERPTDVIDEILGKFSNHKLDFDKYEMKIIINALNNYRYKLKNMNEPRTEVNDILLKMIEDTEKDSKKKILLKIPILGNIGRY